MLIARENMDFITQMEMLIMHWVHYDVNWPQFI